MRFSFTPVCSHWIPTRNGNGPPYIFILAIHGLDGRKDDYVPLKRTGAASNGAGGAWYADIPARELGAPGEKLMLFAVTTVNGQDARGMSVQEYLEKKGRCGMSFGGVAEWALV